MEEEINFQCTLEELSRQKLWNPGNMIIFVCELKHKTNKKKRSSGITFSVKLNSRLLADSNFHLY